MDLSTIAQVYYTYIRRHQYDKVNERSRDSIDTMHEKGMRELSDLPPMEIFQDYPDGHKQRVEGAMVIYQNTLYVLFMATNTTWDWITNVLYFQKRIPYNNVRNRSVRVHSGYMKRYTLNSIRTRILLYVASHPEIQQVVVTGYSMGGGLAPICAVDLAYNFPEKQVQCLAMAGPRVGNRAFVQSVNDLTESLHISYGDDIVVRLPPKIFGFTHLYNSMVFGNPRWWRLSVSDHYPDRLFQFL